MEIGNARVIPFSNRLSRLPWWALVTVLLGVLFAWTIATDGSYQTVFHAISAGLWVTIYVTIIAYIVAVILGLLIALARVSTNVILKQISTFYVEIIRGIPTLVLMLYIAFVTTKGFTDALNTLGNHMIDSHVLESIGQTLAQISVRDIPNDVRVIAALAIAYSAFISEIFRAGIESIDAGQMEAARALGMTYWQAMVNIILRQAIRQVLPPLGNDLIAMLKDSSLVSALGVFDITLQTKLFSASSFTVTEPYTMLAYMYLVMTLILSMGVKWLERRMARERKK